MWCQLYSTYLCSNKYECHNIRLTNMSGLSHQLFSCFEKPANARANKGWHGYQTNDRYTFFKALFFDQWTNFCRIFVHFKWKDKQELLLLVLYVFVEFNCFLRCDNLSEMCRYVNKTNDYLCFIEVLYVQCPSYVSIQAVSILNPRLRCIFKNFFSKVCRYIPKLQKI